MRSEPDATVHKIVKAAGQRYITQRYPGHKIVAFPDLDRVIHRTDNREMEAVLLEANRYQSRYVGLANNHRESSGVTPRSSSSTVNVTLQVPAWAEARIWRTQLAPARVIVRL